MFYLGLSDLVGLIPPGFLAQALDDQGAGVTYSQIIADPSGADSAAVVAARAAFVQLTVDVAAAIDGVLGTRYPVPFTAPLPPFVANAAKKFACEQLYNRRGLTGERNPYAEECNRLRLMMNQMALGKLPLDPAENRKDPSASVITQPLKIVSQGASITGYQPLSV